MQPLPFEFGNALFHIFRTGGPKGFIWKFALSYGVGGTLLYLILFWSWMPLFSVMMSPELYDDPNMMNDAMMGQIGRILVGYAFALVGGLVLWAAFEAASQRRYMRGEGFNLRLGADEGRLLVVALAFFGLFLASYVFFAVLMAVVMGIVLASAGSDGGGFAALLMFPLMLAYFAAFLILAVRFSPAAALTIRDRKIRITSAWRVSRGKAWTIFGSWVLLYVLMYVVMIVIYLIIFAIAFAAIMPAMMNAQANGADPAEVMAALLSPAAMTAVMIGLFLLCSAMAVCLHAFDGPAALAAKNDPDWTDTEAIGQTFG